MKKEVLPVAALAASVLVISVATSSLAVAASTQERLDSIERKLDSRGLVDMLRRIDQLQQDVQELRGEIEVQTHTLKQIQRRQREQYLDIDRRLQQLETGQPGAAPAAIVPPVQQPMTPPGAASSVTPPGAAVTTHVPVMPATADEKQDYDVALAILREGRYSEASLAFNRFIVSYPGSDLADNASYWLGETYYVTRDFDRAEQTFRQLISQYPQSSKVSDSRLKIGYILYEKKDWGAARQELNGVVRDYPGTTAARLAADRLQRMKKEGH